MSKKTWILISCLVLSLTLGLGGSLAYLTDRDADANVFTMGNVDIELTEKFDQGATLVPGVDIEKDVKVKNTGNNDAWVWVDIAIPSELDEPADASCNVVHFNYSKDEAYADAWSWKNDEGSWEFKTAKINGVDYNVYTVKYIKPLAPGETTVLPAMYKVYMDYHIDIAPDGQLYHVQNGVVENVEWNLNKDGAPIIYVSAYAIQTQGFATVTEGFNAYNKQWTTDAGENSVNTGLTWAEVVNNEYKPGVANNDKSFKGYDVDDTGAVLDNVVVKDTTKADESLRALFETAMTGDLAVNNSFLDGTYAMNVTAKGAGLKLTAENTTFAGWTSYAGWDEATFTNCKFMVNSKGTQNVLRAHDKTTLINCELAGTTLSADDHDGSIGSFTLVDCTYYGVKITTVDQVPVDNDYKPEITIANNP